MPRGRPKRAVPVHYPSPDAMHVYEEILAAAKAGRPAPDGATLADVGGRRNASGLLAQLSQAGLISVERRTGGSTAQKRYLVTALPAWTGWLVMRDSRVRHGGLPLPTRKLLDYLQELAASGATLPTSQGLAAAMASTVCSIDGRLRALKNAGLIRTEQGSSHRTRRIFVVTVERWTAWSQMQAPDAGTATEKTQSTITADEASRVFGGRTFEDLPGFDAYGRRVMIDARRLGFVPSASSAAWAAI